MWERRFYAYTMIDATGEELTGAISAPDLPAALEQLQLRELLATERVKLSLAADLLAPAHLGDRGGTERCRLEGLAQCLALAVGAFFLAVLLMATGVVGTPHT